jgi:hypothetical protein
MVMAIEPAIARIETKIAAILSSMGGGSFWKSGWSLRYIRMSSDEWNWSELSTTISVLDPRISLPWRQLSLDSKWRSLIPTYSED